MHRSILIACALLAGCTIVNDPGRHQRGQPDGGEDGGPPDAGPETDAGVDGGPRLVQGQDVCREYARVRCEGYFDCCSAAVARTDEVFETCLTQASADCASGEGDGPSIPSLIADPRTRYDPLVGGEVLTEAEEIIGRCGVDLPLWTVERSGFPRVLTGTVAGGDPCTPDDIVPPDVDYPAFFSCQGTDRSCAPGSGGIWSCLARRQVGESCVLYWDCQDGHFCQGIPFFGATCQVRKPDGMPCTGPFECLSHFCNDAMMCATPTQDQVYCPVVE